MDPRKGHGSVSLFLLSERCLSFARIEDLWDQIHCPLKPSISCRFSRNYLAAVNVVFKVIEVQYVLTPSRQRLSMCPDR